MIELKDLGGNKFFLNSSLIETVEYIPETKITLTSGKYMLVSSTGEEIVNKMIEYNRKIYGYDKAIKIITEDEKNTEND